PLPTPSSWSIKPAGTCPRASSCRPTSPSFCCRRSAQSSTRSRTSGSSCATTGSPTASSNPTTISSTIVVRHGTSSSISLGASCPSDCANGPPGSHQWDLVLFNKQLFQRLEELKPRYFDEPEKIKKRRYKQQIEDTIHELTNGKEAFDFEIYFSEVFHRHGGFDVVIANPPYVFG